jgi:hypothetical protein
VLELIEQLFVSAEHGLLQARAMPSVSPVLASAKWKAQEDLTATGEEIVDAALVRLGKA